jgi:hypothetical protein
LDCKAHMTNVGFAGKLKERSDMRRTIGAINACVRLICRQGEQ